jgi:hypothetical protein
MHRTPFKHGSHCLLRLNAAGFHDLHLEDACTWLALTHQHDAVHCSWDAGLADLLALQLPVHPMSCQPYHLQRRPAKADWVTVVTDNNALQGYTGQLAG